MCGAQNIANRFNEYFTDIGPDLARTINTSNTSILISVHPDPLQFLILMH